MRMLLTETLALGGYATQAFAGGRQAIDGADWAAARAVVVDWMMPGMTGVEVAEWVAAAHPALRRVIVTAAPEALRQRHPHVAALAAVVDKTDLPAGVLDVLDGLLDR
jgi:CheY-like chemotaxis protein